MMKTLRLYMILQCMDSSEGLELEVRRQELEFILMSYDECLMMNRDAGAELSMKCQVSHRGIFRGI